MTTLCFVVEHLMSWRTLQVRALTNERHVMRALREAMQLQEGWCYSRVAPDSHLGPLAQVWQRPLLSLRVSFC
jgi:hypothetical protein